MSEPTPASRRPLLIKLAAIGVVLAVGAVLVLRGYDVKGLIQQGLDLVRDAGPLAFFVSMALLPALGAPLMAFLLTAGSAFAPRIGMGPVILFSLLALGFNMTLSYWLADRVLRPVLEKLFRRLGYRLPQVQSGDATDLVVLLRVTPGVPYPVQNYLLGLARVPFRKFFLVSCLTSWPLAVAFIVFGDALVHGRGKLAMLGLLLIIALAVATHLVRKHYGKKRV